MSYLCFRAEGSIVGPVISYITTIVAALMTRKQYSPFWVLMGISAPIGRIVNAVYMYFRILGYHPTPNFDEYKFSHSLKIEPLIVSVPTMVIVVGVLYRFGRAAWKHGGIQELGQSILSILIGLLVWSQIGPMILFKPTKITYSRWTLGNGHQNPLLQITRR